MPSPSTCTSYRFSPTIENQEELLARYNKSYHAEELLEKVQVENEKVKVEEATEKKEDRTEEVKVEEETEKFGENFKYIGKESISKSKEVDINGTQKEQRSRNEESEVPLGNGILGVKKEGEIDGPQKVQTKESEARRRWRGACKLALHTNLHNNSGAGGLHGAKKLSLPEIRTDSGKEKLDHVPPRRISTGSCKLVMHTTDKANNSDASGLDAFELVDACRADTNSISTFRSCNFGTHTTLVETAKIPNSDPGNLSKTLRTTERKASDPGYYSKATSEEKSTVRKTSVPGPHSKVTTLMTEGNETATTLTTGNKTGNFSKRQLTTERKTSDPGHYSKEDKTTMRKTSDPGPQSKVTTENEARKKWRNACKLVLHTNSLLSSMKETEEEEVSGLHTRPTRLVPKIQVEDYNNEDTLQREEEVEEVAGESEILSRNSGGKGRGLCRLTLHCGEDDQEVTPGALLSISLKKQGEVSKSRRLSDCLLHQVLITNMVHQAEEEVQRGIRESFCFPF